MERIRDLAKVRVVGSNPVAALIGLPPLSATREVDQARPQHRPWPSYVDRRSASSTHVDAVDCEWSVQRRRTLGHLADAAAARRWAVIQTRSRQPQVGGLASSDWPVSTLSPRARPGSSSSREAHRRGCLTWRRVLRSGPTTRLVLVLVLGAWAGAGMAAVAGGRRAVMSFDRLVAWSHASDVSAADVSNFGLREAPTGSAPDLLAQVSALPEIAADAMRTEFRGRATLADGTELEFPSDSLHLVTPEQSAATGELDRSKVVRERLPATDAVDEVAVPLYTAERLDLDVGDSLAIDLTDADGREVAAETVEVTGVTVGALSLPSMSGRVLVSELYASPALAAAYPAGIEPSWQVMSARLLRRCRHRGAPRRFHAAGLGDDIVLFGFESGYRSGVRHIVRLEAQALWVAAGVIVIVGLVVAMQLMLRTGRTADADLATVRALGMSCVGTSRGRAPAAARRLASAVSSARGGARGPRLSPLLPVGLARIADPSPGVHADLTVLAVGVLVTLSAAVVIGASAVLRADRCARGGAHRPAFPAVPTGAPHAAARGDGHADGGGASRSWRRRRPAGVRGHRHGGRVRSSASSASPPASAISSPTHSCRERLGTRRTSWDELLAEAREGAVIIEEIPEVDAVARGEVVETTVDGHLVYTLAEEVTPALRPAITSGRLPREVDEIVVGERMLAALDLDLGAACGDGVPGREVGATGRHAPDGTGGRHGRALVPGLRQRQPGGGRSHLADLARRWEPDIGEWAGFLLRFAPGIVAEDGLRP